jgi:cytochrome P450
MRISKFWGALKDSVISWLDSFDTVIFMRDHRKFLFEVLVNRALKSPDGSASFSLFGLRRFMVFTSPEDVKAFASFGEYRTDTYDPHSKDGYNGLRVILGKGALIHANDALVFAERKALKETLMPPTADMKARNMRMIWDEFSHLFNHWNAHESIFLQISFACTRIIGKVWSGIDDVPRELMPVLYRAEYAAFNIELMSKKDIEAVQRELDEWNRKLIKPEIPKGNSHLAFLRDKRHLALYDLNRVGGLIVFGNISTMITCALLKFAQTPALLQRLRAELDPLKGMDLASEQGLEALKRCPFLKSVYLECLRYFQPTQPLVRYVSQRVQIGQHSISPRTYLFVPLRSIMSAKELWEDPEEFKPERYYGNNATMNRHPNIPFSTGPRMCPAAHGFAELLFFYGVASMVLTHDLKLDHPQTFTTLPKESSGSKYLTQYYTTVHPRGSRSESPKAAAAAATLGLGEGMEGAIPVVRQRKTKYSATK